MSAFAFNLIMTNKTSLNKTIKKIASETGFSACGIADTASLESERQWITQWIRKEYHGTMEYLSREVDKRLDPSLLMENARSLITLAFYYQPDPALIPAAPYRIARYALGKDYHEVLMKKMQIMVQRMSEVTGPFQYRLFTDSGPVLEKAWAVKSGMGWIGKNTLLQIPGKGSWFLLSEILTDMEAEPDEPYTLQHCGNCRRCITACPTAALTEPYLLDTRKCLAYLTLEHKGDFDENTDLHGVFHGCDICQEVCPFNASEPFLENSELEPNPRLAALKAEDWQALTPTSFREMFGNSGILRNGYNRMVRKLHTIP
ncbi:MAG: tRNA epoxyqueuosine(34) reductase QueG [Bacteroidetes bacterium]|nr:tRNA epoxyqueuosine(34) reductase QueG [Bacteroidota bacterium]